MKKTHFTVINFPLAILSAINLVLLFALPFNAMAFEFTPPSIPGIGGTTQSTPAAVLIFSCQNIGVASNNSATSSCSSSGGPSSSCSSATTPNLVQSSIVAWEMTADRPALKTILNDANTTCSEAVEAVGVDNCKASGGDNKTIYTCKI